MTDAPESAICTPRIVIDPDVGAADRRLLTAHLCAAPPAESSGCPRRVGRWVAVAGGSSALLWGTASGLVFVAGLVVTQLIEALRQLQPLRQSPSPAPLGHAMSVLSAVLLVVAVTRYLVVYRRRAATAAVGRSYCGRYVVPADLDEPAAWLLVRAQVAIDVVRSTHVHQVGLLDRQRNDVALAAEEWEIAAEVRTHTRLRAAQCRALPFIEERQIAVLLRPQRDALAAAEQSMTTRVEALERYAQRARHAEEAYATRRTAQVLAGQHTEYRELLARTAAHSHAVIQLDDLSVRAGRLVDALQLRNPAVVTAGSGRRS